MTNPNGDRPWTAGPWAKGPDQFLYGSNKELVVEKGSGLSLRCGSASANEIANGHLIRAAPELFEALIELLNAHQESVRCDESGLRMKVALDRLEDAQAAARRALAKALGAEQ